MINTNRLSTITLVTSQGESQHRISSLTDIDELYYAGIQGAAEVRASFLREVALQNHLLFFKRALEECSVRYRGYRT